MSTARQPGRHPKDGINYHVISGAPTANPERMGSKCAFWYQVTVQPGKMAKLLPRLRPHEPAWRDNLGFSEYFYGGNGTAIGVDPQARP